MYTDVWTNSSREGYTFTGWNTKPDGSGNSYVANSEEVLKTSIDLYAQWEQNYTVIFDANGGSWSASIPGYTIDTSNPQQAVKNNLTVGDRISDVKNSLAENDKFLGWAATDTATQEDAIVAFSIMSPTVAQLKDWTKTNGHTITLYAIWKDDTTSADLLTYTINQHYIRSETDVDNIGITGLSSEKETEISKLIEGKAKDLDWRGNHYFYDSEKTTVNQTKLADNATLERKGTVIDLYYYLDNWKDADTTSGEDTDSETGGDGIPDCQQVKIVYQAFEDSNGTVTPAIEIATIENGKLNKVNGSTAKANPGFAFATWTDVDVEVTKDNVSSLATKLGNETCTPNIATPTGNTTYTYTAIFLKDEVGGTPEKEGVDKPDNIPDAWQYKVTFKVVNGKWNDQTSADVVAYVTNKKDDTPCAKGTEGSKATLDGVNIPAVGSQPNSGYTSSGSWKPTLSTGLEIKEDTVFTYTYDQKSGGGGGSGGSSRPSTPPTVDIPDDVPTGLNGKDHYAYIIGYGNNDVRPQNNITRAEVATIFFRLLTDETREANMTKSNSYNDVKDGDWFCCAVSTLSKMGIIKGYEDGSFKPNDPISRAEFAAIAARFDPDGDKTPATFADVTSHWAKDEISIAANHGWIKGYEDGSFKPDQKITRAETMTLVNRVLNRLPETKDDLHKDMKTWVDNMDETAWYYLAVQEATNSHYFKNKTSTKFEQWTDLRDTRDWSELEK